MKADLGGGVGAEYTKGSKAKQFSLNYVKADQIDALYIGVTITERKKTFFVFTLDISFFIPFLNGSCLSRYIYSLCSLIHPSNYLLL